MSLLLLVPVALAAVGEGDPPPGLDDAGAPRRVALVVGVDDYFADAELGDLRFAGADARAMGDVLAGEGYEVVEATGQVTTQRFWQALDDATATLQRDDVLVVFLAGHAQLDAGLESDRLQLLFSESRSGDAWSGTPLRALAEALEALPVRQRVVVIDACYSRRTRALLQSDTRGPVGAAGLPEVQRFEAWIFAAAPEQAAQEDPVLGHGVFTCYLLEALRGDGDLNGDGQVGVLEAFDYAGGRTAAHTDYAQIPRIAEDRIGWSDLPLVGRRGAPTTAILPWVEARFPGVQLFVDGALRGPGPLEPGGHAVRIEEVSRPPRQGGVNLTPGAVLDVAQLRRGLPVPGQASLVPVDVGPVVSPEDDEDQQGRGDAAPVLRAPAREAAVARVAPPGEVVPPAWEAYLLGGALAGVGDYTRVAGVETHVLWLRAASGGGRSGAGIGLGYATTLDAPVALVQLEGLVTTAPREDQRFVGARLAGGLGGSDQAGLVGAAELMALFGSTRGRGRPWRAFGVGYEHLGSIGFVGHGGGITTRFLFGGAVSP